MRHPSGLACLCDSRAGLLAAAPVRWVPTARTGGRGSDNVAFLSWRNEVIWLFQLFSPCGGQSPLRCSDMRFRSKRGGVGAPSMWRAGRPEKCKLVIGASLPQVIRAHGVPFPRPSRDGRESARKGLSWCPLSSRPYSVSKTLRPNRRASNNCAPMLLNRRKLQREVHWPPSCFFSPRRPRGDANETYTCPAPGPEIGISDDVGRNRRINHVDQDYLDISGRRVGFARTG
jgi:hypothetical protein